MSEPPLRPLPATFPATRDALHRLALHVLYLPRREAEGRFGLRATPGGFGTPVFGPAQQQVRLLGPLIVFEQAAHPARVAPVTSLGAAAALLDRSVDPDFDHGFRDVVPAGDVAADLDVDPAAAVSLGELFGFADAALTRFRGEHHDGDPTAIQLWPEHFDIALDVAFGRPADERRANVGVSPGDASHGSPYFYVGPWTDERPGDERFWNASFGAVLDYDEVRAAGTRPEQLDRVSAFFGRAIDLLTSAG